MAFKNSNCLVKLLKMLQSVKLRLTSQILISYCENIFIFTGRYRYVSVKYKRMSNISKITNKYSRNPIFNWKNTVLTNNFWGGVTLKITLSGTILKEI